MDVSPPATPLDSAVNSAGQTESDRHFDGTSAQAANRRKIEGPEDQQQQQQELVAARTEIDRLHAEMENAMVAKSQEIEGLEKKQQQQQQELVAAHDKIKQLRAQRNKSNATIERIQGAAASNANLRTRLKEAQREATKLREDLQQKSADYNECKRNLDDVSKELKSLKKRKKDDAQVIKTLRKEKNDAASQQSTEYACGAAIMLFSSLNRRLRLLTKTVCRLQSTWSWSPE